MSSVHINQLWLVTVPNNKDKPENNFQIIQQSIGSFCHLYNFKIPSLTVGTLDSLLALSDDLVKINLQVENVVRKVERQYHDIEGSAGEALTVRDKKAQTYFKKFAWDVTQYQTDGKPLAELVGQIQSLGGKIEDELKTIALAYTEKNLAVAATERKKLINLTTSDFEDFLKPEDVAKIEMFNTESLLTIMVVVSKALENEFLSTYHTLGSDIAAFGGPDWTNSNALGQNDGKFGKGLNRTAVTGSPVVPKSHVKVAEEGEAVMYAVTMLRGHYEAGAFVDETFVPGKFVDYLEPLKVTFREKRFVIREFSYDSSKSGGVDKQVKVAKADLKAAKASAVRWCKTNYGEIFVGWVHLKVIRAFVESVLRYGLPADNLAFFIAPDAKHEKELKKSLVDTILTLRPELRSKKIEFDETDAIDEEETLPFVCHKFNISAVANI